MTGPLGERVPPPKPADLPEWEKTARPGVWKSRVNGRYQTWFDNEGRPKSGSPNDPVPVWPFVSSGGAPYIPITQPVDIEC